MRMNKLVLAICTTSLLACSVSGSPVGTASQPSLTAPTTIPPTSGFGDPGTVVTLDAQGNTNWVGGAWYVPLPVSAGDVIGTVTAAVRDNGPNNGHTTDGNNVLAYLVSRTSTGDTTRAFWSSNGSGSPQTATLSPSGGYTVKAGEEMLVEFAGLKGGAVPGPSTVPSMTGPVTASPRANLASTDVIVPAAGWAIRQGSPTLDVRGFWALEQNGSDELVAGLPVPPGNTITSLVFHFNRASSPLSGELQFKLFSRQFGANPTTTSPVVPLSTIVSSGNSWTSVNIATTQVAIQSNTNYWMSVVGTAQFIDGVPLFDAALISYAPTFNP